MAAPLWSRAFGLGLKPAVRVCQCSQRAQALHALRAGRISAARHLSAAAVNLKTETRTYTSESRTSEVEPSDVMSSEPAQTKESSPKTPHSDQPLFETLEGSISQRTLKSLTNSPFRLKHMSPVQAAVLPLLPGLIEPPNPEAEQQAPRDLMVRARTGTGKTLAFLIPAVESRLRTLREHAAQVAKDTMSNSALTLQRAVEKYARTNVGALIISPTRELATQIANEAIKLTQHHEKFEVRLFVGGLPKRKQLREWNLGRRDIVVATPGRLRDFIENDPGFKEDLYSTEMFILDEADTLLEMGFREDIYAITEHLKSPPERQTFMFSATMATSIQQVARKTLSKNHTFLNCVPDDAPPTHMQIPQYYTGVPSPAEQVPHIMRLIAQDQLENPGTSKVLMFLPTTRMVQLYSDILNELGPEVLPAGKRTRFAEMHSKKAMASRINTSDWFRKDTSGATVMLTSDVSARGVDYPGVTRVIQVGVPSSGDGYVHRVGRTGRGSNMKGRADLVLLPWELGFLTWRLTDIPIQEFTTNQLKAKVAELAEKYDENPDAFLPVPEKQRNNNNNNQRGSPRAFRFDSNVAARLNDVEDAMSSVHSRVEPDAVKEAISSVLAFYASNAAELRVDREVAVAGVHAWAEALSGEKMRLRIPREFIDTKFKRQQSRTPRSYKQNKPENRWEGRGSHSARREHAREDKQWEREREFDFDRDISGEKGDRRGRERRDDFGDRPRQRRDDFGDRPRQRRDDYDGERKPRRDAFGGDRRPSKNRFDGGERRFKSRDDGESHYESRKGMRFGTGRGGDESRD